MISELRKQSNFLMLLNTRLKWHENLERNSMFWQSQKGHSREAEEETKMKVKEFFERDGVSCLCPGKKDCVSVKLEDGRKEKVQKRPLLSNLKEIYQHFLTENPAVKVGFSTFAMLRPKWCVPVVSSGTHNVFVCTYHQNVKLMLSFKDGSLDYKEVLKACVRYFHQIFHQMIAL